MKYIKKFSPIKLVPPLLFSLSSGTDSNKSHSKRSCFHLARLMNSEEKVKVSYVSRGPSKDCVFLRFQWRPSCMLRKKSWVESTRHAVGTGQGAILHTSASPGRNCFLSFPSNDAHAWLLLLKGTCTRIVTCSGNIRGRNDKECGQIGVNRIPGTWRNGIGIEVLIEIRSTFSKMIVSSKVINSFWRARKAQSIPGDEPLILQQPMNMQYSQMSLIESTRHLGHMWQRSCHSSTPGMWGKTRSHDQLWPRSERV